MSEENKIEEENTKKLPVKKRYIFTSLAIIGALAAGYFIYDALGYQSTDDAYVETTTVSVSPKVSGQIVKVLVKDNRAIVEGINMVSKHTKPNAKNPQGGIEKKEAPIHISNLNVVDPKSGKPTRIGRKLDEKGALVRYSKKSGEEIK